MICAASSCLVLLLGVAVATTGRGPLTLMGRTVVYCLRLLVRSALYCLTLLVRSALHLQAAWLWMSLIAWPAVMRERCQYRYCLAEAHRRIVESPAPAAARQAPEVEGAAGKEMT